MLTGVLFSLVPLALVQETRLEIHADEATVVELAPSDLALQGHGPAQAFRFTSNFSGTLYVWAASEEVDALVRVETVGGEKAGEDDGLGGLRTPCVAIDVEAGREWIVTVAAIEAGRAGALDLHLVSAPETEETRAAASAADDALEEASRLASEGEDEAAHELLGAVLKELHAANGAERSSAIATASQSLGGQAWRLRAIRAASIALEWTHTQRVRCLPDDHPQLLGTKGNLALTRRALGNLAGVRELQEEVLAGWSGYLGPEHADVLDAKHNLASTRVALGDLAGARELQEEVLAVRARRLDPEHRALLTAKNNLAMTRVLLADFVGARELQEEVLAIRTRILDPEHADLLRAKQNLAATMVYLEDYAGARKLQEEVLAVWSRLRPAEHPDVLLVEMNLAGTMSELGDNEGARKIEEKVLAIRTRSLDSEHPDLLRAKHGVAETRFRLGDLAGARELQDEVLAVRARVLHPANPDLLRAQHSLAATRSELGDFAGARELVVDLLAGMRARARELRMDSPRSARQSVREELDRLAIALMLTRSADAEETLGGDLLETLESLRAVSIGSSAVALALDEHPELTAQHRVIADLKTRINDLSVDVPAGELEYQEWRTEFGRLTSERDRREWELRSALGKAGVFADAIDVDSISAALSPHAIAVSYLRYPRYLPRNPATGKVGVVDSLIAFVVEPERRVQVVRLGPAQEIERLLSAWRAAIGKPVDGSANAVAEASSSVTADELGARIRERIIDPILAPLREARVLHVVPDDFLYLIPFDALPLENDRLGERYTVHTEVSLARLCHPPRESTAEPRLLLVGGVDYDAELASGLDPRLDAASPPIGASGAGGSRAGDPSTGFRYLPGTAQEIETIGTLFAETAGGETLRLAHARATKAALHGQAQGARYLHIATHGWFAVLGSRSQLDPRELDGAQRERFVRAQRTVRGFAPETLCGLALAGANLGRDSIGRVPGIMTAEELAVLDLRNCELAVLSGCATNVGIRRAGQGIQSLQNALHAAGVRTALTSLWKVDDRWTHRLMDEFYTRVWRDGTPKARALWEAKMVLREEQVPASEWAAWVLTGDPR